jgi:heat shock protein HslJ
MRTFLALLLLLAGCAGAGTADAGPLAGEWVLVDGVPTVDGYPITLRVEDGALSGTAACNGYGGDVAVSGDRVSVGGISATEMGCPDPGVHESEAAYLAALQAVERAVRTDDELVLTGPEATLRFAAVPPEEPAPLVGTTWELASLVHGAGDDGAVSSTTAPATLELAGDGTLRGSDGCNDLDGRWVLDGDVLRVREVSQTDMACPGDDQAEHVAEVLLGDPAVRHEGRTLRLMAGARGLDYRAP